MNERDLLEAGAVLPLGGAPEAAAGDVLVARGYRHPALDDRVVVRLVPEALGEAEDLALEFLGFGGEPAAAGDSGSGDGSGAGSDSGSGGDATAGDFTSGAGSAAAAGGSGGRGVRVGRVKRQALGFPAWALVHDPANGRHALAVVKEMERLARIAVTKPGHAKDGFEELATRLDRSVPHFLPTYYEEVARHFLGAEATTYASAFFGKARDAERRHALAVDEERLREVFLEFAAAGALSGKTLREQAKGLAERLTPQTALEEFRLLCVERGAAGLSPYAGLLEDLRRLAKAAGRDAAAEEVSLVSELLKSSAVARAAMSFWKSARGALVTAARQDPAVRVRLLHLLPTAGGEHTAAFDETWLEILEAAGAFTLLARTGGGAGAAATGEQPPTAAAWFGTWAAHRQRGYWRRQERMPRELELVERFAAQLAAEREPVRLGGDRGHTEVDLDLLDACLAHGVPVTGPGRGTTLNLRKWLDDATPGRRDLAAVVADPRFGPLLPAAVEKAAGGRGAAAALHRLASGPVLGPVVGQWLTDRAAELEQPLGLPGLDRLLSRVSGFTIPSALAAAPVAAARIAAFDVAPVLARTLRAGILDELGWPALDQAPARLRPGRTNRDHGYRLEDAWPALIVAEDTRVLAIGPEGVLDDRTLTLPAPNPYSWMPPVFRWLDGQWLVASGHGDARRAVWSGRPADTFRPKGTLEAPAQGSGTVSVPLPGGGRFYGTRPMQVGDTSFGDRRPVASDGISYWVLHEDHWYEYDPATATRGRASVPAFFDGALAEGPRGARLLPPSCRLLPVRPGLEGSPFGSKDGLLGWWVRYDPAARTMTACSVDGTHGPDWPCEELPDGTPVISGGSPLPPLRLPGGAALHARVSGHRTDSVWLYDAEGLELAHVEGGAAGGRYARGTAIVPPVWYWHALRARDEAGSAVLRTVTDAQAAALIAAMPGPPTEPVRVPTPFPTPQEETAATAVRALLPGISHPALVEGIAALAMEAARLTRWVAAFAGKKEKAAAPASAQDAAPRVRHAHDGALNHALRGLASGGRYGYYGSDTDQSTAAIGQVLALHRALSGAAAVPAETADGHPPFTAMRGTNVNWLPLLGHGFTAAAARAAAAGTSDQDRAAVLEFLQAVLDGPAPYADPRGRLRVVSLCEPGDTRVERAGQVLRAGDRTLLLLTCTHVHDNGRHWQGVEHDPEQGFGAWEGFDLKESTVIGAPGDPAGTAALARLITLTAERGPVPYRHGAAERFAALTGVDVSLAALLLLGLPEITGYGRDGIPGPETLALAGLRPTRAVTARDALRRLSGEHRIRLLARLMPADPAAVERLWADGFDPDALADEWIAIHGRLRPVPIELLERAERETSIGEQLTAALNPRSRPELTGRTRQRLDANRALVADDPAQLLSGRELMGYVSALRWLAYRLPYGDPLRAALPETLTALRSRLADEQLLLDLSVDWTSEGKPSSHRVREAYGLPRTGGHGPDGTLPAGPAIVLVPARYGREHDDVWVRPAALLPGASPEGGPGHSALTLLTGLNPGPLLWALREVLGDGLDALVAADGPAGAAQYPAHSAPELVTAAAQRLGLSQDAAALYLMLLALPDPTDRNVTAWTGWKPARSKQARAELAAGDLVVEARRPRAGRTLFLPGGWLDHKAPQLPLETWKTALFRSAPGADDGFVVPDCPVPELFRQAWQRVADGDAPGFEEFAARRTGPRGGRR